MILCCEVVGPPMHLFKAGVTYWRDLPVAAEFMVVTFVLAPEGR